MIASPFIWAEEAKRPNIVVICQMTRALEM